MSHTRHTRHAMLPDQQKRRMTPPLVPCHTCHTPKGDHPLPDRHSDGPTLLTVPEAMAELRISRWMLYNLIRTGRLDTVTIGRRRLIPRQALSDYVNRLMQEVA